MCRTIKAELPRRGKSWTESIIGTMPNFWPTGPHDRGDGNMKRLRGSGPQNSAMNRDQRQPRPNSQHAGIGRPHGVLHEAPARPMVNAANYGTKGEAQIA